MEALTQKVEGEVLGGSDGEAGRAVERRTIYDLAERAGVSLATISRWLNSSGYVGAATRARIEATAWVAVIEADFAPCVIKTFLLPDDGSPVVETDLLERPI